tara:strand:+ start:2758 stop:2943 length:186 start_codon:yes stop_codon:yes gene_type:complete
MGKSYFLVIKQLLGEINVKELAKITSFLTKVINEKFWGEIIIKFKDGRPTILLSTAQVKLD